MEVNVLDKKDAEYLWGQLPVQVPLFVHPLCTGSLMDICVWHQDLNCPVSYSQETRATNQSSVSVQNTQPNNSILNHSEIIHPALTEAVSCISSPITVSEQGLSLGTEHCSFFFVTSQWSSQPMMLLMLFAQTRSPLKVRQICFGVLVLVLVAFPHAWGFLENV